MSYVVLARKYRPQVFKDLAGQERNVTILQRAVEKERIAHAYLFSGSRGVGKTTAARIFAKMLNCEAGLNKNPCNKCDTCKDITSGRSLSVIEIDGASNRGIDEIRDLREKVKYPPSSGRYKVYIIDEVHMLTTEAFNALLKTLEEPPSYIVFIFATTEPHKIPSTILSRCLRFEFKRIFHKDLFKVLKKVAGAEKIDIEPDAIKLLGYYSDGSLRDALGILDQVSILHDKKITHNDIVELLGITPMKTFHLLAGAIADNDFPAISAEINNLINNGKSMEHFLIGWIDFFRDMLHYKMTKKNKKILSERFSSDMLDEFSELSDRFQISNVGYILQKSSDTFERLRYFHYERYLIEFLFLDMLNKINPGVPPVSIAREQPEKKSADKKSKITLEDCTRLWTIVRDELTVELPEQADYLNNIVASEVNGSLLVLYSTDECRNKRIKNKIIKETSNRMSLKFGSTIKIDIQQKTIKAPDEEKEHLIKKVSQDSFVQGVQDLFGGTITDVKKE